MSNIDLPDDLHDRLRTVADRDYGGASLAETFEHLLAEHQEHVVVTAAAETRENAEEQASD
jgi:CO dehydrogenase/acetyl-CoA synthase beta subunit